MTVLRMKPYHADTVPRQRGTFPAGNRYFAPSLQVQDWTKGMVNSTGRRRSVITGKASSVPAFSAKGIRRDVLAVTLVLLFILFAGILFADVEAIRAGRNRIGQLSSGIESLEGSNALLEQELSVALRHPPPEQEQRIGRRRRRDRHHPLRRPAFLTDGNSTGRTTRTAPGVRLFFCAFPPVPDCCAVSIISSDFRSFKENQILPFWSCFFRIVHL